MKKLLFNWFDIRAGEGGKAFLMFAFIFFLIASFLIVKPVRDALFVEKLGSKQLPFVYILVALFSAVIASLYSRYSKKVKLQSLILATLLVSIACIQVFWFVLHVGYTGEWFLYAFYIWVAIFGVITGAQFWLLANDIFNAREAKRLFGFIGTGAIVGGIFGGYLTSFLAKRLKTENLLFLCTAFLIICILLLWLIRKQSERFQSKKRVWRQKKESSADSSKNSIQLILESRHLALLAGIIGVSVVVANLVDYQFKAVAEIFYSDAGQLTYFFGFWNSTLNILSLFIQLFLTARILRNFGVATSLFFMPLGLFLGAVMILVSPAVWSAILIKMSDGGFKHSINKAGFELLSVPISSDIKIKTKSLIDIFIKNLGEGIGGLLLIVFVVGLNFSISLISLVTIGLIAAWIYMIVRIKSEYIDSFRQAIEKRTIDIEEQALNLDDAAVFKSFRNVLDGKSERQILYVLKLLEDSKNEELIPYLKKLIQHPSPEIKNLVLKIAIQFEEMNLTAEAEESITSTDQALQIQALQYLYFHSDGGLSILKGFLTHNDYRVRIASMICVSREWKNNQDFRKEFDLKKSLDEMLQSLQQSQPDGEQKRFVSAAAAEVIGITNNSELYPYLFILVRDESIEVVKAAVVNIGRTRAEEFIPVLISHLDTKHIRKYSRESLAEYGESIIDRLSVLLEKTGEDRRKRRSIPKVLALISSQKSVNVLLKNLEERDLLIRFEIIKALNKLRAGFPNFKFTRHPIEERIEVEARDFISVFAILQSQKISFSARNGTSHGDSERIQKAWKLLIAAFEEKLDHTLERIFRLLGLKYIPKDVFHAYLGIKSDKANLRANALEFLDNILDTDFKRILIPIVEATDKEILPQDFQKIFGVDIPSEEECRTGILRGDDNWLKVCTLYHIAELEETRYLNLAKELVDDPDPLVKETSAYYLERVKIASV